MITSGLYQALCRHPFRTANSLAESVDQRVCLNLSYSVTKFLERLLFEPVSQCLGQRFWFPPRPMCCKVTKNPPVMALEVSSTFATVLFNCLHIKFLQSLRQCVDQRSLPLTLAIVSPSAASFLVLAYRAVSRKVILLYISANVFASVSYFTCVGMSGRPVS